MEEKKSKRGGKREGAGRPQSRPDSKIISIRLETELLENFPPNTNKSLYINKAVRAAMLQDGLLSEDEKPKGKLILHISNKGFRNDVE